MRIFVLGSLLFFNVYAGEVQSALQEKTLVTMLNKDLFFAVKPPVNKIYRYHENAGPAQILSRFTTVTHAWVADNCSNNIILNDLVDTVIAHIQKSDFKKTNKSHMIVLDIDDTIMSRYWVFYNKMNRKLGKEPVILPTKGFSGIQRPNEFILIAPMFRLYQFLLSQNFKIAFVTARIDSAGERDRTVQDLHYHGFTTYDRLFMRPEKHRGSAAQYKEWARGELVKYYDIIATFDDDYRNLRGNHVGQFAVWIPTPLEQRLGEDEFYQTLVKAKELQEPTVITG